MGEAPRGFIEGERIAKLSTFTLTGIGIVEVLIGQVVGSIGLTADGVDSLADTVVTLIVWLGLRYSKKASDERFHFGYLKFESLAALFAALGMVGIASTLIYYSSLRFFVPKKLSYPVVALATLVGAGIISVYRAFQMRSVAKKYNLISLKTGAYNSIKDASASFVVLGAILLASLGFTFMDAVGGFIVGGYILSVAYFSIKEASQVLTDACHRPELVIKIREIIEKKYPAEVEEVRMRRAGPYVVGIVGITADGDMTLNQVARLKAKIKGDLRKQIDGLGWLYIVVHPQREKTEKQPS